ncbi:MurR/RpiR family transcriptional regulator [Georgenia halophila]|uniref:MurR/RpiR family transcriptional regulator n=1 Tax=Georgenia halophila TaxID=620889 RepID=A0ABP8L722_9MICO
MSAPLPVRLRGILDNLRPSTRRVAEYVLADPRRAAGMTITRLAEVTGTSQATIVRLCQEAGLDGYRQFRLTLAADVGRRDAEASADERTEDIAPSDDLAAVVAKIAFTDARAVQETAQTLSVPDLESVVEAVVAAPRTDVYGVGASGIVAADLEQKLRRIGLVAAAHTDAHLAITSAALLRPGDVAVGLSHSGMTADTVDALATARRAGATTVAVTDAPRSAIAAEADHVLLTAARETTFRSGATASRLAQLTVVDCIFVGVAQRTYDSSRHALEVTRAAVGDRRLVSRSRTDQRVRNDKYGGENT